RGDPQAQAEPGEPARGRHAYEELRRGAAVDVARGSERHPGRRDARPADHRVHGDRGGDGTSGLRDRPHRLRGDHGRPDRGRISARPATTGPLDPRRLAARGGLPVTDEGEERPRPRARGRADGEQRGGLEPDPQGQGVPAAVGDLHLAGAGHAADGFRSDAADERGEDHRGRRLREGGEQEGLRALRGGGRKGRGTEAGAELQDGRGGPGAHAPAAGGRDGTGAGPSDAAVCAATGASAPPGGRRRHEKAIVARIDSFLRLVAEQGASDLHFHAGNVPIVRHEGELMPLPFRVLSEVETGRFLLELLGDEQRAQFEKTQEADLVYSIEGVASFRVNIFVQSQGLGAVFSVIPNKVPTLEELNLPPTVKRLTQLSNGLVLVTGPTGSVKSTTLAAMVDEINKSSQRHVISIEDPIEFLHQPIKGAITQRQVGKHAESFSSALRSALRESPDVLVVGEMRDLETIHLAIAAAETG